MFPGPQDMAGPWHGSIVHPLDTQKVDVEMTYAGSFPGTFHGMYYLNGYGSEPSGTFTAHLLGPFLYVHLDTGFSPGLHFHLHILTGPKHTMMYGAIPPSPTGPSRIPFATVTVFKGTRLESGIVAAWQEFFTELK